MEKGFFWRSLSIITILQHCALLLFSIAKYAVPCENAKSSATVMNWLLEGTANVPQKGSKRAILSSMIFAEVTQQGFSMTYCSLISIWYQGYSSNTYKFIHNLPNFDQSAYDNDTSVWLQLVLHSNIYKDQSEEGKQVYAKITRWHMMIYQRHQDTNFWNNLNLLLHNFL